MTVLKAPFPYFGGKSVVAGEVWRRFGNVACYVEPFFGSGAVLLGRPRPTGLETVNDADALLCNFWRALQADPAAVARHADWPVSEVDLHARHLWLLDRKADVEHLLADPTWYDAQVAGWWVWGLCAWIGSGWCSGRGPWRLVDGVLTAAGRPGIEQTRPHLGDAGQGINRKLPHLGDAGRGVHRVPPDQGIERKRPALGNAGRGIAAPTRGALTDYLATLADRLRRVRVTCGDWTRVLGPSVTTQHGLTAVFLDPPYSHTVRANDLYRVDEDVAAAVRDWAVAHGDDPALRIALCGYADEHAMPPSWTAHTWKAAGGYGSQGEGQGRENAAREVVWFSPACIVPQASLFDLAALEAAD